MRYSKTFVLGVINGVLFNLSEALIGGTTVLPIFISEITHSKVLVGLSGTMGNAGWFMPQLLVANLIGHLKRKLPVYIWSGGVRIATIWGIALVVALIPKLDVSSFLIMFFLLYSIYSLAGGVAGIPFMDVVAKSIPSQKRGTFFGARLFFGGIAAAFAGPIVKDILARQKFPANFTILFTVAALIVTFAILSFCFASEPEGKITEPRMPFVRFLSRGPFLLKNNRSYRLLLWVRILLGVWGMALPFYILYAREHLKVDPATVGLFLSIQMIGSILSNLIWGYLSNRKGNKIVLVLVSGLTLVAPALTLIAWFGPFFQTILWFSGIFLFIGFALSGIQLGYTNYMLDVSPEGERPTYLGFMNTFLSPVFLLSALGGYIIEKVSYEALFLVSIASGALSLMFALQLEEPRQKLTAKNREPV